MSSHVENSATCFAAASLMSSLLLKMRVCINRLDTRMRSIALRGGGDDDIVYTQEVISSTHELYDVRLPERLIRQHRIW